MGDFLKPPLVSALFNVCLEKNMEEALKGCHTSISIGVRLISDLCFAVDMNLLGKSETELQEHATRLEYVARECGMEISEE